MHAVLHVDVPSYYSIFIVLCNTKTSLLISLAVVILTVLFYM